MPSNFQFLSEEWPSLCKSLKLAEQRVYTEPVSTAAYCRTCLEECIHHIYRFEHITVPYNTDLFGLIKNPEVESLFPDPIRNGIHYIRVQGNAALHFSGKKLSSSEALITLRYAYALVKWFANNYSEVEPDLPGSFNESIIPRQGEKQRFESMLLEQQAETNRLLEEIKALKGAREEALEKAKENEAAFHHYRQTIAEERKAIQQQRESRKIKAPVEFTEAETRQHLIDIALKEAGWGELTRGRDLEYPVVGMPLSNDNPKGNGFVDYVLWDDNGKPLALIEAKRTKQDEETGRHQALLYANCLEQMHGQRPIIFYSNGYITKIWDDLFYSAPRRVYGFYSKSELQWLIQQRSAREDIRAAKVNREIAGRPYQIEAIQRVTETFATSGQGRFVGNRRNALLVMATGSGKTRTAAALVDVLFKHNWIRRVLFLADRNALVTQAKNNFSEYLPDLSSIDLTSEKENNTTRLVFSTYPTMMNMIDKVQNDDGRFYGVGHFDLIIIDEAHRSVYNRYKAIFEYFDALLVGLTATPKDSIDHNTFELFDCSTGDPTFEYTLHEAVPEYLVLYRNIDVSTKFLSRGIKYDELSDGDKIKYEETFRDSDSGDYPDEISSSAFNKWLFNKDTVYKILDHLMTQGLKIEGGDKIGRTIIFAVNQNHAKFIVQCFQERYPQYASSFISMVHHRVSHAQSIIEAFCDPYKENNPQITVSVDMMDTGIDAPRVLNLVFFKMVKSKAKFWQMIGRGTRLCPDVYGPGQPKTAFLIFDAAKNFEFFQVPENGEEAPNIKPISQLIFETRLSVANLQLKSDEADNHELGKNHLDILHKQIKNLDRSRFQVNMKMEYVDRFSDRVRWDNLSTQDVHLIEVHISGLPIPENAHESSRRFELMMLKMQQAHLLEGMTLGQYQNRLIKVGKGLQSKYTIPEVKLRKSLIDQIAEPRFYKTLTQRKLEEIRVEIRELVKYLEASGVEPVYTNIQDSELKSEAGEPLPVYSNIPYKERVESYVREHKSHLVIDKIRKNMPITEAELQQLEDILFDGEERGTKDEFIQEFGEAPLGTFIRQIVGLDVEAANEAFAELLNTGSLRSDQITFLRTIIDYLKVNGVIDKKVLFEPPFTDLNDQGLLGVFDDDGQAMKVINILDGINRNAEVG